MSFQMINVKAVSEITKFEYDLSYNTCVRFQCVYTWFESLGLNFLRTINLTRLMIVVPIHLLSCYSGQGLEYPLPWSCEERSMISYNLLSKIKY